MSTKSIEMICQSSKAGIADPWGALSFPIYQSATFAHKGLGESTGYDYTRMQNPTREQLEYVVAELEHGIDAITLQKLSIRACPIIRDMRYHADSPGDSAR